MPHRLARAIVTTAAAATILACGGDSTSPDQALASVSVAPRDAVLYVGTLWPHMHQTAINRRGMVVKSTPTWATSDSSIVAVDAASGAITGVATGQADVQASVTVGGVTKVGTSHVSVVDASSTGEITGSATLFFSPQLRAVNINGAPATISWTFQNVAHTVTWDSEPEDAAVTDIPATSNGSVAREFTVAGEYSYHCSIHPDMTGSILVQ